MSALQENIGLVKKFSWKVWERLSRFETELELEDLEQEACQAFIDAEKQWVEGRGAKLSTYVSTAILNRLNFVTDTEIQKIKMESERVDSEDFRYEDWTANDFDDELLIEAEFASEAIDRLSPVAKILFRETFYPSNVMIGEFRANEAAAALQGKRKNGFFYMKIVEEFLIRSGISQKKVLQARKEIIRLGESNA